MDGEIAFDKIKFIHDFKKKPLIKLGIGDNFFLT